MRKRRPPASLEYQATRQVATELHLKWVAVLACGFVIGGPLGAAFAARFTDHQLRWMFVSYLFLLTFLSAIRKTKSSVAPCERATFQNVNWPGLAIIGAISGMSSGLLGIGGGLAITALSVLFLRMSQHQAQALSLMMTALPLTLPAAWVYVRHGSHLPWWAIAGMLTGLIAGSKLGSIVANRLPERNLRFVFIALILALAIYMAVTA
ncbi:MAG TPA: sulfite exporter TauE/SafE family protein [Candidatus Binatus sp.]|nr:sulfite exporter TauE/SafE family protein [Candidatus Binatus sp.]